MFINIKAVNIILYPMGSTFSSFRLCRSFRYNVSKIQVMINKINLFLMEYKKYRVKSIIKTFRDLEVYQSTTSLASEIYKLEISDGNTKSIEQEKEILIGLSKQIPKLIAESYGDKFSDLMMSLSKLENCMRLISDVIAKIDFLLMIINDKDNKEKLNKILSKYQTQRRKILNLKKSWERVFKNG